LLGTGIGRNFVFTSEVLPLRQINLRSYFWPAWNYDGQSSSGI